MAMFTRKKANWDGKERRKNAMLRRQLSKLVAERAPVLTLDGIRRSYGSGAETVIVLDGLDLALASGEAVAIIGPSGSGKSTLLQIAGLLDSPDVGEVRVCGELVRGLGDAGLSHLRNGACGYVYQFHHLLREFTALENVLMPMKIGGRAGPEALARAEDLLETVGLGHRQTHYPDQLSGGEQQRVALARALMNRPRLLLADEPTGNLDPHTAEGVADTLFDLVEKEGMAALIVTHNPTLAARCTRALEMREGRLVPVIV